MITFPSNMVVHWLRLLNPAKDLLVFVSNSMQLLLAQVAVQA